MSIDPERAKVDRYPDQRFHAHDERVRHADVVHYVRQVRHPSRLRAGSSRWVGADPIVLLALPVVLVLWTVRFLAAARSARREEWTVGVVALPAPDTFQDWSGPQVVHEEVVRGDEQARDRIAELVAEIRAGERRGDLPPEAR